MSTYLAQCQTCYVRRNKHARVITGGCIRLYFHFHWLLMRIFPYCLSTTCRYEHFMKPIPCYYQCYGLQMLVLVSQYSILYIPNCVVILSSRGFVHIQANTIKHADTQIIWYDIVYGMILFEFLKCVVISPTYQICLSLYFATPMKTKYACE